MDSDGSIFINKAAGNYVVTCTLLNTRRGLVDWLVAEYGGTIHTIPGEYLTDLRKDGYLRKDTHQWRIVAHQAEAFLKEIRPFLILKQEQADCALKLRRYQGYHMRDVPQEEKLAKWHSYYLRMRELNRE
jgi:hypothetical protein